MASAARRTNSPTRCGRVELRATTSVQPTCREATVAPASSRATTRIPGSPVCGSRSVPGVAASGLARTSTPSTTDTRSAQRLGDAVGDADHVGRPDPGRTPALRDRIRRVPSDDGHRAGRPERKRRVPVDQQAARSRRHGPGRPVRPQWTRRPRRPVQPRPASRPAGGEPDRGFRMEAEHRGPA